METSPRYPLHLNSKSQTIYTPLVSQSKTYSAHHLDPTKSTLETMYATKESSNPNADMTEPKKGNIFQNAFNSLTNVLVDQLVKAPATLINNFSNVNNTLSVTIVPNEGIISHAFFKTLTSNENNLSDNIYTQSKHKKEPLMDFDAIRSNSKVHIPKDEFLRIANDSKFPVLDDFDLCLETESMFLYEKPFDNNEIITNEILEKKKSESNKSSVKDKGISKDEITSEDKLISPENMQIPNSSFKESTEEKSLSTTNLLSNMLKKVVNTVTDHFRPLSSGSEGCAKRYQTSKTRRKPNFVSRGRGRGRGKSQLRRNGVSQTTHRKERCNHDIGSDIQDDLDSWVKFDPYTVPSAWVGENKDLKDTMEDEDPSCSLSFEFIDITPETTNKEKTENFSMQDKYVPECPLEEREANCTIDKTICRPRLISETSVDSEDSFIVFDTEFESNVEDFNCSEEDDTSGSETESASETESESESETDDEYTPTHKVFILYFYWRFFLLIRKGFLIKLQAYKEVKELLNPLWQL